jgi:hypothetical protein
MNESIIVDWDILEQQELTNNNATKNAPKRKRATRKKSALLGCFPIVPFFVVVSSVSYQRRSMLMLKNFASLERLPSVGVRRGVGCLTLGRGEWSQNNMYDNDVVNGFAIG